MDNNLNNNTENNVNVGNVIPGAGETTQVIPTPVNIQSIQQPTVSPASNVETVNNNVQQTVATQPTVVERTPAVGAEVTTASISQPTVTQSAIVQSKVTNTVNNDEDAQKAYYKKIYTMMGIIVGSVLLIAGILLYFLLNGSIENRNRLTCTKTIQGEGYQEHIKRYYTFDNGLMMRVYLTHTYTYDNLTDDLYEEIFGNVISNDNQPLSKYGFGTGINRDGNVVTVTAYDVNYFESTDKDMLKKNKEEGFTCD